MQSLKRKYHKSPTNTNLIRLNIAEKLLANQISLTKSEYKNKLISNFTFKNQSKTIGSGKGARGLKPPLFEEFSIGFNFSP